MSASGESSTEFADYGEIIRRRWPLILLGLLAGVGLAMAGLYIVPKTYTSVALVQVKSVESDTAVANGRTSDALNLDTEAQLVTSNDVATRARQSIGTTTSARDLVKKVSVTVPPNTSVLSIGFSASSAAGARAGAQAFAEAYLANRKADAESDLEAGAAVVRSQVQQVRKSLADSDHRLAQMPSNSSARADEEATNSALNVQLRDLQASLTPLVQKQVNPGTVITDAQLPRQASNPNPKLLLISGLLAGLLLGCLLAFVADRADRRIRDRRDLERLGLDGLTGTVAVPAIRDAGSALASGPGAESLRQLRNALLAQMRHRQGVVLVANASDAEGGSAVAVSLAVTIARSGMDVALLSANTVRCAVEKAFGSHDRPGLVNVLQDRADVADALFAVAEVPHLTAMAAGADGSLSSELLQGPKIESVIQRMSKTVDVVVVDVAPTAANADAQTLATVGDGVLLVATALRTRRDAVLEAVDQLRHVSARVYGSVVVTVNRERRTGRMPSPTTDEEEAAPAAPTEAAPAGSAPAKRTKGRMVDGLAATSGSFVSS